MNQSFSYNSTQSMNSYRQTKQDQVMTNEQFEQIVEAILGGKYSWACVLILRFAGYNPLHYIPYRTYNRLIKDNCLKGNTKNTQQSKTSSKLMPYSKEVEQQKSIAAQDFSFNQQQVRKIEDLRYIEDLDRQEKNVMGGFRHWFGLNYPFINRDKSD